MHGWTRVRSLSRALASEDSDTDAHTCTHTYGSYNIPVLPVLRKFLSTGTTGTEKLSQSFLRPSLCLLPPASPYLSPSAAATTAEIFESRTLGRERGRGGEEGEGKAVSGRGIQGGSRRRKTRSQEVVGDESTKRYYDLCMHCTRMRERESARERGETEKGRGRE
jgi:hypothetical protein